MTMLGKERGQWRRRAGQLHKLSICQRLDCDKQIKEYQYTTN